MYLKQRERRLHLLNSKKWQELTADMLSMMLPVPGGKKAVKLAKKLFKGKGLAKKLFKGKGKAKGSSVKKYARGGGVRAARY